MKNSIKAMPALTIDSSTLAGAYKAFAAAGLTQACSIVRLVNASSVPVTISFDGGAHDHDYLPAGSDITLDLQANSQPSNYVAMLAKGTPISAKGAKGAGLIYLIGYYQTIS